MPGATPSRTAVLLLLFVLVGTAHAQIRLDLPAQPLSDSLTAVGTLGHLNVMFDPSVVDGMRAPALKANLDADDALGRLLVGTKLRAVRVDANTIRVVASPASQHTASNRTSESSSGYMPTNMRVADAKETAPVSSDNFENSVAGSGGTSQGTHPQAKLEEIIVTGTHLRTPPDAVHADLSTYTSADIQASGQATLADFLNTLPAVSSLSSEGAFSQTGAISTVRLHGFPLGTTLVLLNGHRLNNSGFSFFRGEGFDLNYIPVSAIDRIDVSPIGGSAVYGSDAMAGVINIVLKQAVNGLDVALRYGREDGGSEETANLDLGTYSDRGSLSLILSVFHRDNLAASQRFLTANTDFSRFGGPNYQFAYCNPGTISSLDGSNLPGITAPVAAIPPNGPTKPTISDLIPTAGQTNLCSENHWSLVPEGDRVSGILSDSYQLADALELFSEILFARSKQNVGYYSPGFLNGPVDVPATNAFNPFGTDVLASTSLWLGQPKIDYESTLVRPLVGARGAFSPDWTWELSVANSNEANHETFSNVYLNQDALTSALESSDPSTAINLFSSGPIASPKLANALRNTSEGDSSFGSQSTVVSALIRGRLFDLPGGSVQLAMGGEALSNTVRVNQGAGTDGAQSFHRSIRSGFLEIRTPLIGPVLSNLHTSPLLSLTAAARTDSYSDVGTRTTPQFGLGLQPMDELLIAATYGRTFRAPQLFQLYYPATTAVYPITDPATGQTYNTNVDTVGNRNLAPETGVTKSIGFAYAGKTGLEPHVSATFWSLTLNNYVQILYYTDLLTYESLFPKSIVRNAAGQISSIQQAFYNFGQIKSWGLDFSADVSLASKVGIFKPSLAFTYMDHYTAQITPLTPETNRVSAAYDNGLWTPRWKGIVGLNWKLGLASASVAGRYTGPYQDYDSVGHELGDFWYLDANVRYDLKPYLGHWAVKDHDAYVSLSVVNALNKLPPFSYYQGGFVGYDNAQYDIRGRLVSLELGFGF